MAGEVAAVSQYPEPPHYYRLYRDGAQAGPPPPPPVVEEFTLFGAPFNLREPLAPPLEVGALFRPRPDGTIDAKQELLQLNRLLLCLFLELLSVLVEQPTAYAETLTRVIGALQNMQHLANLLRPQQARHTLEHMLKTQIARKREALAGLRTEVARIREQLGATVARLAAAGDDAAESAPRPGAAGATVEGGEGRGASAMDTS
ncbi:Cofactor required for Sp1 transcriptional activation subunit, putative [Monoraphidium neglectum]|uniref:Mediator of RNA polymerase II transcription subunit 7 n=1 Tax=Monoraphidium neglectum TaxID=145388 RepID=A0A0D2KQH6_9CHLO|nr:Cofactor required for Sp1 transcriptional activation subunit, putative [Monoraphidium neglectum]KIY97878.1 Cofactor required for Sp1 transcriptional activation subunit, putative [Monoraphidium neglectum]|eukprot:XP_013896898.1 Cofactor required for Sp1 transcriptional activation subunit, putative [Monoraphidium neglectum]